MPGQQSACALVRHMSRCALVRHMSACPPQKDRAGRHITYDKCIQDRARYQDLHSILA
jgi:hypothetical protein